MTQQITGLLPDEITEDFSLSPSFRGMQIFEWINKGVMEFSEMTNLPESIRSRLEKDPLYSSTVDSTRSDSDGTSKITVKLSDGKYIESVLLVDSSGRKTACLSSQAGCAMGCRFCRTATMGLHRNLSAGEIVEQFLHLKRLYGSISHIVFMGMGEPLANLKQVIKAIEVLHHPKGQNIGYRKITVSTSGLTSGIKDLADSGIPVRLAVSLITADSKIRSDLMPVPGKEPLSGLKKSLEYFQSVARKRITLEYVLLGGVNDNYEDAVKLRDYISGIKTVVNLIPWNPVDEIEYSEPSPERIRQFTGFLDDFRITYTTRFRKGRSVNGACGQLAVIKNSPDSSDAG